MHDQWGKHRLAIFNRKKRLNLALQGGGAHGAFTWGVIDRLLEEPNLEFGWISAASAGAVNAVALAHGLANGSRDEARDRLRSIWEGVHKIGVTDLMRLNPFLFNLSRSPSMAQMAALWSPYDLNPLGFDPMRRLLTERIDFDLIRAKSPVELLIAATEVQSGRARLFRKADMSVEAVLASACLPVVHHAVEIDGVAYWDGGFSANPDLVTLAMESPVADTLIVEISPLERKGVPTGAREIQAQQNRLTFNAPLQRDVEIIETAREAMRGVVRSRLNKLSALAHHRFHLIEAGEHTASLSDETRMKPDWAMLNSLFEAGRSEATIWLSQHGKKVGKQETVDLRERFGTARAVASAAPEMDPAANESTEDLKLAGE